MLISEREAGRWLTISGSSSLFPAGRLLIHGASPAGPGREHRLRKFTFQFEAEMRGQVSGRGFGAQGQGHSAGKAPPRSASRALSDRKASTRHKGTIRRVITALPAATRSSLGEGLRE